MRIKPGRLLRWMFPNVIWSIEDRDGIYLTFDDGPDRTNSTVLLNNLLEMGERVTFFVLGNRIKFDAVRPPPLDDRIARLKANGERM